MAAVLVLFSIEKAAISIEIRSTNRAAFSIPRISLSRRAANFTLFNRFFSQRSPKCNHFRVKKWWKAGHIWAYSRLSPAVFARKSEKKTKEVRPNNLNYLGPVPGIEKWMANFKYKNHHFSGAILHYLWIFNWKFRKQVGNYIAMIGGGLRNDDLLLKNVLILYWKMLIL